MEDARTIHCANNSDALFGGRAPFGSQGAMPESSGAYYLMGDDGQVLISIEQHKCDRIIIVRKNNYAGDITSERHVLLLDGREHSDTRWLGHGEPSTSSAKFVGSELSVEDRVPGDSVFTTTFSLTADRDLQEDSDSDVFRRVDGRRVDSRQSPFVIKAQR
jgi:hypothetical protein